MHQESSQNPQILSCLDTLFIRPIINWMSDKYPTTVEVIGMIDKNETKIQGSIGLETPLIVLMTRTPLTCLGL